MASLPGKKREYSEVSIGIFDARIGWSYICPHGSISEPPRLKNLCGADGFIVRVESRKNAKVKHSLLLGRALIGILSAVLHVLPNTAVYAGNSFREFKLRIV